MIDLDNVSRVESTAKLMFLVMIVYIFLLQYQIREWLKENQPDYSDPFNASAKIKCTKMLMFSSLNSITDNTAKQTIKKMRVAFWVACAMLLATLICMIILGVNNG